MTAKTVTLDTLLGPLVVKQLTGDVPAHLGRASVEVNVNFLDKTYIFYTVYGTELYKEPIPSQGTTDASYHISRKAKEAHHIVNVTNQMSACCAIQKVTMVTAEGFKKTLDDATQLVAILASYALAWNLVDPKERFGSPHTLYVVESEPLYDLFNYAAYLLGYKIKEIVPSRMLMWAGAPVYVWWREALKPREFKNKNKIWQPSNERLQEILGTAVSVSTEVSGSGDTGTAEPEVSVVPSSFGRRRVSCSS